MPASPDIEPSKRLLTPGFASLLVAQAGFGFSFSSFFLLPTYLETVLGATPTQIGQVIAVYGVVAVPLFPLMGKLVDRHGRRDFLTAGAALMALSAAAFVFVDSLGPLVYVLRALQGIAFTMAFVAGGALAVDEAPPDRVAQAIGWFGLSFLTMNAIAPPIVEVMALRVGWPAAFAAASAGAALCCVLSRRVRDHRGHDGPDGGLRPMLRRPTLLVPMLVVSLSAVAMCAMFNFYQLFAIELGIRNVSLFFVAYTAAAVFGRVGLGRMADRFGRRRVALLALALYAPVVAAGQWLDVLGLALLGAGLGLSQGLFYPALNAVAVEAAQATERGKVMALFQGAFNIGMSFGGFGLGLLAERAGYPSVFTAGGLCAFVGLLVLLASSVGRAAPTARAVLDPRGSPTQPEGAQP